ncbi:hypothetical protein A4X13_0g1147 [Tilletia indica]|uniref:Uncharacterized protein n=1 Tax=Tilletia indica TaxID=43049 RepID=A0A177TR75_9BASI|nr:hypothetical protein A4X13_0g1147 [Tilletia indica]
MSQPNPFRPSSAGSLPTSSFRHARTPFSDQQANPTRIRAASFAQNTPLRHRTLPPAQSQDSALHARSSLAASQNATSPIRTSSSSGQSTGRSANASELRALEERVVRLEESLSHARSQSQSGSGDAASQSTTFSPSDRQRTALARLGRNASGGPSAPPVAKQHASSKLLRSFRRLVYLGYGGVKGAAELVRQPYPGRGAWPKHPPSQADEDAGVDPVLSTEDELTSGNQIRLDYSRRFLDAVNQKQLRKTFQYMLSHRKRCGVPVDMTLEELIAQCASTFKGWVKEYTRSLSAAGRKKKKLALTLSCLSSRRKRKADSRAKAMRLRRYFFFSDGTKILKSGSAEELSRVSRSAVRADLEFAVQDVAISDEEDEWEPLEPNHGKGPIGVRDELDWSEDELLSEGEGGQRGRKVRRRVGIPWRSACLLEVFALLDRKRTRQPDKPILPPTRLRQLPTNFTLPSTVRRWMVAESWAEEHKDCCGDVSDNAGPFQGPYSVASAAKAWGGDPDWTIYNPVQDDGDVDGEQDVGVAGSSTAGVSNVQGGASEDDEGDEDPERIGPLLDLESGWGGSRQQEAWEDDDEDVEDDEEDWEKDDEEEEQDDPEDEEDDDQD